MDPVSALSLAGNIIQFIEFGRRLLSKARELYKSPVGTLAVHDEIVLITTDLAVLVKKLREPASPGDGGEENDSHWQSWRKICDEAASVAEELLKRLGTLKLQNDGRHQSWESVKVAVRSNWNEKEIASLSKRLAALKEALDSRALFSIRDKINQQSIQASARFDALDHQNQHLLSTILGYHDDLTNLVSGQIRNELKAMTITVSQILSRLEPHTLESRDIQHRVRDSILGNLCERTKVEYELGQEITAGVEMLAVSDREEEKVRGFVHAPILNGLRYEEMTNRYEDVGEAHPETFEWAFEAPSEGQSWSDLSEWLKMESGVYWVSGKAGSGKSTFMKHLVDDRRKRLYKLLKHWAGDTPLCIATFFFWNSGTNMQKSQVGFLQALLFQVLNEYPELIPIVIPKEWSSLYSTVIMEPSYRSQCSPVYSLIKWTLARLKEAFRRLSRQTTTRLKICFVVDGLDEFDGDDGEHDEMGQFFKEITKSKCIKICLSSRPWVVFEDLFSSSPHLRLQDLTYRDIEQYVHEKFYRNSGFLKLADREPTAAPLLLKEIIEKADGVFLWVKLVVRSLLQGMRNRDDIADLSEQLRRLPRDIKPLDNCFLQLIGPYERWASQAIQILRCNRELSSLSYDDGSDTHLCVNPLTIFEFSLAMSESLDASSIENMTWKEFQVKCEDIKYFHRTAKDFLEAEEVWTKLLSETAETNFNPNVTMMKSCLWYIKIQIVCSAELVQKFYHYDVEASSHALSFLGYAFRADPDAKSRQTQTHLIEQLDGLITKYNTEGDRRYDLLHLHGRYNQTKYDMLQLSTIWYLGGFVRARLQTVAEWQRKSVATLLLQFALTADMYLPIFDGLPCRNMEMILILLDCGACIGDNSGLLQHALEGAQECLDNLRECAATGPKSCKKSDLDYAQNVCSRIEESLSGTQSLPAGQASRPKRMAEEIEDAEASTRTMKPRDWPKSTGKEEESTA